jgi:hypothetical protein
LSILFSSFNGKFNPTYFDFFKSEQFFLKWTVKRNSYRFKKLKENESEKIKKHFSFPILYNLLIQPNKNMNKAFFFISIFKSTFKKYIFNRKRESENTHVCKLNFIYSTPHNVQTLLLLDLETKKNSVYK